MISYQWTSAFVGICVAVTILLLVQRDYLHSRFALWWLLAASLIGVLGVSPKLVDAIGEMLGISYPPVLPLVVAAALLIVKALLVDIHASRRDRDLQLLAQRLAILESELTSAGRLLPRDGPG